MPRKIVQKIENDSLERRITTFAQLLDYSQNNMNTAPVLSFLANEMLVSYYFPNLRLKKREKDLFKKIVENEQRARIFQEAHATEKMQILKIWHNSFEKSEIPKGDWIHFEVVDKTPSEAVNASI